MISHRPTNFPAWQLSMERVKHFHFIGIGGSGMSGIAEIVAKLGFTVSGSDLVSNRATARLKGLGVTVYKDHVAQNIGHADVIVVSTAIQKDNVEYQAAQQKGVPIIQRAQMLAEIMRYRFGIAVAGTHGKTTTTSMLVDIFTKADVDPSYVIGGCLNSTERHADLGIGKHFIVEADESDASFLHLSPIQTVITNIDADHMATYQDDFSALLHTFSNYIEKLPFYGLVVACIDDIQVRKLISKTKRHLITYGFSDDADIQARAVTAKGLRSEFEIVILAEDVVFEAVVNMPGEHNILNALAAFAIAKENGIAEQVIISALAEFQGVGRRFQVCGELQVSQGAVTHIDDYGHHPKEISATVRAIRTSWPSRRLVLAFQPHRYTRTQDLFSEFAKSLAQVDELILLDVYPAGEEALPDVNSQALADHIATEFHIQARLVHDIEQLIGQLDVILEDGDILLTQGAGNIGNCPDIFAKNQLYRLGEVQFGVA